MQRINSIYDIPDLELSVMGKVGDLHVTSTRYAKEAQVLATLAANAKGPIVEFGTAEGYTAKRLAENAAHPVHTLNPLPEDVVGTHVTHRPTADEIGRAFKGLESDLNIVQHYSTSLGFDPEFEPWMVFIDGCHDYPVVLADSRRASSMLATGGVIVWHDYKPGSKDDWNVQVCKAVDEFCDLNGGYYIDGTTLAIQVKP
jgi:predicted O-methyltransferase YrrM